MVLLLKMELSYAMIMNPGGGYISGKQKAKYQYRYIYGLNSYQVPK